MIALKPQWKPLTTSVHLHLRKPNRSVGPTYHPYLRRKQRKGDEDLGMKHEWRQAPKAAGMSPLCPLIRAVDVTAKTDLVGPHRVRHLTKASVAY